MDYVNKIKKNEVEIEIHDARIEDPSVFATKAELADYVTKDDLIPLAIKTTMQELFDLKAARELIPGCLYRIEDYAPTYETATAVYEGYTYDGYRMAGHQFDIIVLAVSENEIATECWFDKHEGDDYFTNSDLSKWHGSYVIAKLESALKVVGSLHQYGSDFTIGSATRTPAQDKTVDGQLYEAIKITINGPGDSEMPGYIKGNELAIYKWRDEQMVIDDRYTITSITPAATLAYGYISRLVDDHANDCPYDFKNVMYKEVTFSHESMPTLTNVYTFSAKIGDEIFDTSSRKDSADKCHDNVILPASTHPFGLPMIVFVNHYGDFDMPVHNNRFGKECKRLKFYAYQSFGYHRFNTFGDYCINSEFYLQTERNQFDGHDSIHGKVLINNHFGNYVQVNASNLTGCEFEGVNQYIDFDDTGHTYYYMHVEYGVSNVFITATGNGTMRYNIRVCSSVKGADSSNKLTLNCSDAAYQDSDKFTTTFAFDANNNLVIIKGIQEGLPSATSADEGKVPTVNASGQYELAEVGGGAVIVENDNYAQISAAEYALLSSADDAILKINIPAGQNTLPLYYRKMRAMYIGMDALLFAMVDTDDVKVLSIDASNLTPTIIQTNQFFPSTNSLDTSKTWMLKTMYENRGGGPKWYLGWQDASSSGTQLYMHKITLTNYPLIFDSCWVSYTPDQNDCKIVHYDNSTPTYGSKDIRIVTTSPTGLTRLDASILSTYVRGDTTVIGTSNEVITSAERYMNDATKLVLHLTGASSPSANGKSFKSLLISDTCTDEVTPL